MCQNTFGLYSLFERFGETHVVVESQIVPKCNHFHDMTADFFATDDISGDSLVQQVIYTFSHRFYKWAYYLLHLYHSAMTYNAG